MEHEHFGSADQQRLQARAEQVWTLLQDDPRYCCHGRAVALADATADNLAVQLALARLQGVSAAACADRTVADARDARLQAEGMKTDRFADWRGEGAPLSAARAVLDARALPDDLTVHATAPDTSAEDMAGLDRLTQSCGVLLPMGSFLRGRRRPTICLYAKDRDGRVVGASASVAQHHPDHRKGPLAWWGMLSTDDSRRGEGIALILGAMAICAMNRDFGVAAFLTGIREGNLPSEALCAKLGLARSGELHLISIAPDLFAGGRLTK